MNMLFPDGASVVLRCPCKVNLYLRITGIRPDGYHELDTLFFPLAEPSDTLTITPGPAGEGLRLTCSDPTLAGEGNLVAKAWRAFAAASGFAPDLRIHLDKRVPMGAGLGGGSADAAKVLSFLNTGAGERALGAESLLGLAAKLGADVPFFLLDGPALATGIGERLRPVRVDLSGHTLLLACPPEHVNTAWAYREWDRLHAGTPRRAATSLLTDHREATMSPLCPASIPFGNDFEQVVFPAFPRLSQLKRMLLESGADQAVMSGSGASIFALFREEAAVALAIRSLVREGIPSWSFRY